MKASPAGKAGDAFIHIEPREGENPHRSAKRERIAASCARFAWPWG